jgi:hypothetical protein
MVDVVGVEAGVISVVTEFMVDVAGLEASIHLIQQYTTVGTQFVSYRCYQTSRCNTAGQWP